MMMFNFIVCEDLCFSYDFLECLFIEIHDPFKSNKSKGNIVLGCLYRPPGTDVTAFNLKLHKLLNSNKVTNAYGL